jgi:hypothetical protein
MISGVAHQVAQGAEGFGAGRVDGDGLTKTPFGGFAPVGVAQRITGDQGCGAGIGRERSRAVIDRK